MFSQHLLIAHLLHVASNHLLDIDCRTLAPCRFTRVFVEHQLIEVLRVPTLSMQFVNYLRCQRWVELAKNFKSTFFPVTLMLLEEVQIVRDRVIIVNIVVFCVLDLSFRKL